MPAARAERLRGFLSRQGLGEGITWRADELVMRTGYLPLWRISLLLYPAWGQPILFVPELEPRDSLW